MSCATIDTAVYFANIRGKRNYLHRTWRDKILNYIYQKGHNCSDYALIVYYGLYYGAEAVHICNLYWVHSKKKTLNDKDEV